MSDASAVASYRQALAIRGEQITITRITGFAPSATTATATVQAMVSKYMPDGGAAQRTGMSEAEPGGVTQTDRMLIIMAVDLSAASFPLPLQKNDRILLSSTGETLNVTEVDMSKRSFAGAIELLAGGIG